MPRTTLPCHDVTWLIEAVEGVRAVGSQLVVGFWQKAETPRTLETTSYQWEAELKSRETSGQIQPFRAQEKKKKKPRCYNVGGRN